MYISLISTLLDYKLLYLDPVSQGAILQAVLGILLAITLFVRAFWSRIKSLYERLIGKENKEETPSIEDSPQDIQ